MENSHCCLSCSQSISQLQVKTKQETQRHFRVNGQQQLKRNGCASAPSWDSKGNCLPTPETNPLQPNTTAAPVPKHTIALHICHARNFTTLPHPDTKDDGWPTGMQYEMTPFQRLPVSLLISPDACYGEKMYSGSQCQNKAEDIKADPTATSF